MRAVVLVVALAVTALACARDRGPRGDPSHGVEVVTSEGIADFHAGAQAFYRRLANRRVNTFATYNDRVLRERFRSERAFADYYADIAQDLIDAHFERNRPVSAQIAEFVFDGPGRARVRVRLVGENGLPLRPGTVVLEREDRWERIEGRWWILPGKL